MKATCSVDGCDRDARSRGWCQGHYFQWRRGQQFRPLQVWRYPRDTTCSIDECDEPVSAKGLCEKHYGRKRKTGTTDLLPAPPRWRHGSRRAWQIHGCRCSECKRWHEQHLLYLSTRMRQLRSEDPDGFDQRTRAWIKADNDRSRETAARNGYEWTGPELELAMRDDLTAREVATLIGRTVAAVHSARRKVRRDPRFQNLAGLATED